MKRQMNWIDCKKYADEIIEEVSKIPNKTKGLLVLTAGDDPASAAYMRGKEKDCERCGIPFEKVKVNNQDELMMAIKFANIVESVGGILVQLPLPDGFDAEQAISAIAPEKDVDGFRADSPFLPCTPEGILYILEKELGDLSGKAVLLIGKGKLVGKPLIPLLLDKGCTLTIAHSKTQNLDDKLWQYHDAVITAVGKPKLVDLFVINSDYVIDAGISRDETGKLCGDCCYFSLDVKPLLNVTPVPGGVGLMTRAMLMKHMGEVNK